MTFQELRTLALDVLGKAFKGDTTIQAHVVAAAAVIVTAPDPNIGDSSKSPWATPKA